MKECLFWCKDKEKNRDGQGKAPQSNNYYTFITPHGLLHARYKEMHSPKRNAATLFHKSMATFLKT